MRKSVLGLAALGLFLVAAETASAQGIRIGSGYSSGYSTAGLSYTTRIGGNGILSVGYGSTYPAWGGYGYAPTYIYTPAPVIYTTPVYYAPPVYSTSTFYYSTPSFGLYYSNRPTYHHWRGW